MSSTHIAGILNVNANHLSRPVSKAPTWASVIEQSKPHLGGCQTCQIPRKLLGMISSVLNRNVTGAQIATKTTALWALEPTTFTPGSEAWASHTNMC